MFFNEEILFDLITVVIVILIDGVSIVLTKNTIVMYDFVNKNYQ